MRILFIVPYPTEGPSNRFRVEQYLPGLKKKNITYSVRPFCNVPFYRILPKRGRYIEKIFYLVVSAIFRLMDVLRSTNYDILFVHREAFPTKDPIVELLFRRFGKKIIYDFDDSIFLKKPAKVKALLKAADCVIAGNRFLKDYASGFNKEVVVIPTCVDTDRYRPGGSTENKDKIVIGWMGTPTTAVYLYGIKNVFRSISRKYKNVEFRIIGGVLEGNLGIPVVAREWSLNSEIEELRDFDIGIMPMPDNDWTKGKCAFKVIQYMAVGIPSVASPVGMNREVIEDEVNGFLALTDDEWCEKLSRLIESRDLRKRMGSNGRKTIEEKYSLKVNFPKFDDVLVRYA